jgi:hypothetical protein
VFSSAVPTPACTEPLRRSIKCILIAAGLATAAAAPVWAAQLPELVSRSAANTAMGTDAPASLAAGSPDAGAASALAGQDTGAAVDPQSAALHSWRKLMTQNPAPVEGCFHASYPNVTWDRVECKAAQPGVHPVHVKPADGAPEVTGNGHDYVAKATGLISSAAGTFSISGVTSEKSVGVAAFGGGGILGRNEYSVQLNTNDLLTTSACAGHSGCHVWQQFVYATDYIAPGEAAVFMQYWLLDWGSSSCPGGWGKYGTDCFRNSALAVVPDVPITDLGGVELGASATAGGTDSVTLYYGADSYTISGSDSVVDISAVWDKVEFNVVGDAGGSRADFNSGSSVEVTLDFYDGSATAPTCVANDGTTGETNNLNLGACTAFVFWGFPFIQFTESN